MPQVPGSQSKYLVMAGWDDCPHLSAEAKAQLYAATPAHLRDARSKGIPVLGDGAIFPVPDESLLVDDFPIPAHWFQIGGLDFGWDHPTAAVRLAIDRDTDTYYVTRCYAESRREPLLHAAAVKTWGSWLPWAWPHDGNNDTAAGPALAGQYREQGLFMLPEHATHAEGGNSVEAGLMQMLDLMSAGRWKVFRSCGLWMSEKRLYHRKEGKIVKLRDDVISASRYAYMMRRFASQPPRPPSKAKAPNWRTI